MADDETLPRSPEDEHPLEGGQGAQVDEAQRPERPAGGEDEEDPPPGP